MELLIQFAGWSHQTASLCRMMFLSLFNKLKVKARDFTGYEEDHHHHHHNADQLLLA
jgi:hypothetical protein